MIINEKDVCYFCESIAHEIIKTAVYLRVKGSQYFGKLNLGITFEQYIALDAISHNPDMCQRDLCKHILKDRSNTGRILNILEENGFIERSVETKNKRLIKKINISPKGQKMLDDNAEKIKNDFAKVFEKMSDEEFITLKELLLKYRNILSEDTNIQI